MAPFRFRQFTVNHDNSSMKVNTDAVLLGAGMTIRPGGGRLLDIGTGPGTIALMAAQRLHELGERFTIEAIDIDAPSAAEAAENFAASPWSESLSAHNCSLSEYARTVQDLLFDHIFSNPPYFESSLKAPDLRRRAARHTETLSYRDILSFASAALTPEGHLSLILPSDQLTDVSRYAAALGLYLFRLVEVFPVPSRPATRSVMEFHRLRTDSVCQSITIRTPEEYSSGYLSLTAPFLFIQ